MYGSAEIKKALASAAVIMAENCALLSELDAAMGDGDLGLYMQKGFEVAAAVTKDMTDVPAKLLKKAGMSIMNEAPSTLGTLIGLFVRGMAAAIPADAEGFEFAAVVDMFQCGYNEMTKRGKAQLGEKTILDSMHPAIEAMRQGVAEGADDKTCVAKGLEAAKKGMEAATNMKAIHGRPSYFGEKTIGMQDGGATVGMLLLQSLYNCFD